MPCWAAASGRDVVGCKRRRRVGSGCDCGGGGSEVRGPGRWLGVGRRASSLAAALERAAAAAPAPRRATNTAGDMRVRAAAGWNTAAAARKCHGGAGAAAGGAGGGGGVVGAAAAVEAAEGGGGGGGAGEGAVPSKADRPRRAAASWCWLSTRSLRSSRQSRRGGRKGTATTMNNVLIVFQALFSRLPAADGCEGLSRPFVCFARRCC
jgi:hypothetical protein